MTDSGLANLSGLSKLQGLWLRSETTAYRNFSGARTTDSLWAHGTSGPEITDSGLTYLEDLLALRFLDLSGTLVTDTGVESLKEFGVLETLGLAYTSITDEGLVELRELRPALEILR